MKTIKRQLRRDAKSGKFVTAAEVKRRPRSTVTETRKFKAKRKRK